MTRIALLWDASSLWGLLVWQALDALGAPCRLVKANTIVRAGLDDKFSLLVVPGGSARLRSEALGKAGRERLSAWIAAGGRYLGFCGGAGLALSDAEGLGICPWRRAGFPDRLRHLLSGHVLARLEPGSLTPDFSEADAPDGKALLPVWWPSRFGEPQNPEGVRVLARYAGAGPDLHMADFALADLPAKVREQWHDVYGIRLEPALLEGEPCVICGEYGKGRYVLSYSHLETPGSPAANAWLALLLRELGDSRAVKDLVPPWEPGKRVLWADPALLACRRGMDELMDLGLRHGLLFPRSTWLTGWRAEVPGAALNSLSLALRVLVSRPPGPRTRVRWRKMAPTFAATFALFRQGAESHLLARRLAATVPDAVPRPVLAEQRAALFGSAMRGSGLYQELMDMLEDLLFLHLQAEEP